MALNENFFNLRVSNQQLRVYFPDKVLTLITFCKY